MRQVAFVCCNDACSAPDLKARIKGCQDAFDIRISAEPAEAALADAVDRFTRGSVHWYSFIQWHEF